MMILLETTVFLGLKRVNTYCPVGRFFIVSSLKMISFNPLDAVSDL